MLDAHTHILPAVDDGSRSIQESVEMLKAEAAQGIDAVILSPHFYADRESPERFFRKRSEALDALDAAAGAAALPAYYAGAEVAFFTGMSRTDEIDQFCIGDTRTLLVEMPFCRWNDTVLKELSFLQEYRGIQPLIAHVERYMSFQPASMVRELCESGVWIQANASFFLRWQTSLKAMRMLKKRFIHFIGSDCHGVSHRPPNMGQALAAIEKRLGADALRFLEYMEGELLEGI